MSIVLLLLLLPVEKSNDATHWKIIESQSESPRARKEQSSGDIARELTIREIELTGNLLKLKINIKYQFYMSRNTSTCIRLSILSEPGFSKKVFLLSRIYDPLC